MLAWFYHQSRFTISWNHLLLDLLILLLTDLANLLLTNDLLLTDDLFLTDLLLTDLLLTHRLSLNFGLWRCCLLSSFDIGGWCISKAVLEAPSGSWIRWLLLGLGILLRGLLPLQC